MRRTAATVLLLLVLSACASAVRQVPDAASLAEGDADAYRDAAAALERGDATAALSIISPLTEREPWHVPSHVIREDALIALGREAEARSVYEAEAARVPGDPARVLLAARLAARAESARENGYRSALRLDPQSVWARIALAYELMRAAKDESDRAMTLADGGFTAESDTAAEHSTALGAEADRVARELATSRPDLAAAQGALCDVLLGVQQGGWGRRVADALAAAEAAAKLDSGTASVWARLGRARRAAGDDEGAAKALTSAVGIAPRDARLRADLGRIDLDLRRDAEAEQQLAVATTLAGKDAIVAVNHAVALFRLGRLSEAAAEYDRAAGLDAADPRPHWGLALTRAELGDRAGAAAAMQRYLDANGPDREAARTFIESMAARSVSE